MEFPQQQDSTSFVDGNSSNPHNDHLGQVSVATLASTGDTTELDTWNELPYSDQDTQGKDLGDQSNESKVEKGSNFDHFAAVDDQATEKNQLVKLAPIPKTTSSTLGNSNSPCLESPSCDSVDRSTANMNLKDRSPEQQVPVSSNDRDTPSAISTGDSKDMANTTLSDRNSAEQSAFEKSTSMASVEWLNKLQGAGPDYDGEWDDSPSRGTYTLHKKSVDNAEITTPATNGANDQQSSELVRPKDLFAKQAINTPQNKLAEDFDNVELGSPSKYRDEKISTQDHLATSTNKVESESSLASAAPKAHDPKKGTGTGGFVMVDFGPHTVNHRHQHMASKTPYVHPQVQENNDELHKSDPYPKLKTPAMVSPLPTYTQAQAQATHNLNRRGGITTPYGHPSNISSGRTKDTPEIVAKEYADVSVDMLDYQMGNCGSKDYPTYYFPGTYDAVKQDTYEAAKNVSTAAATFGNAMGQSGVGKALWSVGTWTAKGVRRAGTVVGTQATLSAINHGYRESIPQSVARWAETMQLNEERKAEKKKPTYRLAGDKPRKGKSAEYVSKKDPFTKAGKSFDLENDSSEEDWTVVNVQDVDPDSLPLGVWMVPEKPTTSYEAFMQATESTAVVAAQLGRKASALVRTARAQPNDYFDQQRKSENWPKNLQELTTTNRVERMQTIPRLNNPHFTKLPDAEGNFRYTRPGTFDTDDDNNNFEDMTFPEHETGDRQ